MRHHLTFLLLLLLHTCAHAQPLQRGDRQKINLNRGWQFHEGTAKGDPTAADYNDATWQRVSVPHTPELVSIEMDSTLDTRPQLEYLREVAWYRKKMPVPNQPGKRFFLEFEAVHQVTDVWVNGQHAGQHAVGGYTPFHFDVTDLVRPGEENTIVVKADNTANEHAPPDPHKTDYVKFGGLYRDVYLVVTNPLHVTFNWEAFDAGVHITTPSVRKHDATVQVKTTVRNDQGRPVAARIVTSIIDADDRVVQQMEARAQVPGGGTHSFRQSTAITENLHLWHPDHPYLYRVHSQIYANGELVDFADNPLGIRWFELVDGKKFMLNGEPLWLVGVNRHQNWPIVGDAVPDALGVAEAEQYKAAGMNCVRLSHYTQDDSFLEACDRLGLLVYEEAPTWIDWGDRQWWANLESALRTTIRDHRNHPSIIIWGGGINHRGDVPIMHFAAKEEDPWRLTASASSNGWTGRPNAGVTDIYATMDYRNAILPDGDWALSMEHRNNHDAEANQLVISRYKKTPRTFGALAWVGADYNQIILEGDRVSYRSHSGVLDHFRVPRPVYDWYRAEYGSAPVVSIGDERASYDGLVRVFANAEEVELFQDGKLVGRERPGRSSDKSEIDHPTFYFHHDWTAGTLTARGYVAGQLVATDTLTRGAEPAAIRVEFSAAHLPFVADGADLRVAHAYLVDANGHRVWDATNELTFAVTGAGTLVDDPSKDIHPVRPELGKGEMYVRSSETPGQLTVTVSAAGLRPGSATITTVPFQPDALAGLRPFRLLPSARFDVGQTGTLNEIGWTALSSTDATPLPGFGPKATLTVGGAGLEWSEEATMFGNLSYVGADGVFTEKQAFELRLAGLAPGTYRLKTYHHPRKDGPLLNQVRYEIEDAGGERQQKGRKAPMGYHDKMRIGEQEPLAGEITFTVGADGKASVTVRPVQDVEGAFWLNGIALQQID